MMQEFSTKETEKMKKREIAELHAAFNRTTDEIFSMKEWDELLRSGKRLRVKYGVDVTAPYLHIGHAVNLWMMRRLQEIGHKVIFLIGDFTTQIGDPTGKSKTRPVLPQEEIERNTAEFIEQAKMVLHFDDPNTLEIRRNSEWYGSMAMSEFLKLMSMVTHGRLLSRDMFQKRIAENADIYMHELVYPILQGYDSFMLHSDLTIIGSDQLFNEMMGRFYQEKFGQKPQVIITTKITPGIDGVAKQSKSLDNYIGLGHSPRDKFGRLMRLPDALIHTYFDVYTEVQEKELHVIAELVKSDPLEAKKQLACAIVARYHNEQVAQEERQWFEHTFSRRQAPPDLPELLLEKKNLTALEIVRQFFGDKKSSSEVRRLFQQGAITLNDSKLSNPMEVLALNDGDVFQVGKRSWFKVRIQGD
jgi:tyrosyl-tRNA synthetase